MGALTGRPEGEVERERGQTPECTGERAGEEVIGLCYTLNANSAMKL